jgi:hypothetical protein
LRFFPEEDQVSTGLEVPFWDEPKSLKQIWEILRNTKGGNREDYLRIRLQSIQFD